MLCRDEPVVLRRDGRPLPELSPTALARYVAATSAYPGTYHGFITITAPAGLRKFGNDSRHAHRATHPRSQADPANLLTVVNAGSLLPGPISPGEIGSAFGLVYTPDTARLHVGPDGTVNRTLYGNRVLFNGIAAPLTYLSGAQINAVVP